MDRQQEKGDPGILQVTESAQNDQRKVEGDIKQKQIEVSCQSTNKNQQMGVYISKFFYNPTKIQLTHQFLQCSLSLNLKEWSYNPKHLFQELQKILFRGSIKSDNQELTNLKELSGFWKEFDICDLYQNVDVVGPELMQYYSHWILTARVMIKLKQFFYNLIWKKLEEKQEYQKLDKIREYLAYEQLQFVYSRELFAKKRSKFSYKNYDSSNYSNQYKEQKYVNFPLTIYYIAKEQKIEFIIQLFDFLAKIGVIRLTKSEGQVKNEFMDNLQNIKRQQQRELFVTDYACLYYQQFNQHLNKGDEQFQKMAEKLLPNYMFYKNRKLVRSKKMNIQKLHEKYKDYDFLEGVHDYIQWMFPNHYGSCFNSNSSPLSYLQSELFLKDERVAISLFHSMIIFFDFMGLSFNTQTFKLQLRDKQRLMDVILVCMHNHLRIMRILACLSVSGFRQIALDLIDLLDRYTKKGQLLQKERSQFQRSWLIYGEIDINKAKEMCFLQREQFPKCLINWREILQKLNKRQEKKEAVPTQLAMQVK